MLSKQRRKTWIARAFNAADLMQGYVDIANEAVDELSEEDRKALLDDLKTCRRNDGPDTEAEVAGAIAILNYLLAEKKPWDDHANKEPFTDRALYGFFGDWILSQKPHKSHPPENDEQIQGFLDSDCCPPNWSKEKVRRVLIKWSKNTGH